MTAQRLVCGLGLVEPSSEEKSSDESSLDEARIRGRVEPRSRKSALPPVARGCRAAEHIARRRLKKTRRVSASSPCGGPQWRPGGKEADDARQSLQQCHQAVSLVSPPIGQFGESRTHGQVGAALQSGHRALLECRDRRVPCTRCAKSPLAGQRAVSGSAARSYVGRNR
jgi:hypothetical protein